MRERQVRVDAVHAMQTKLPEPSPYLIVQVAPRLLDSQESLIVVPVYLDTDPRQTRWILSLVTDGAKQPIVCDDALDELSVGVWGVDDSFRLLLNAHVEQGDRIAPTFPLFVDPLKRDGGRNVPQQKAGLFRPQM